MSFAATTSRMRAPMHGATVRGTEREFTFTDADFERIRRLIRARSGIAMGPAKRNLVYSRVSRLVRAAGLASFHDYLEQLEASADAAAHQAFVNALTTNLTSFFRESHHFPVLARHLTAWPRGATITIWCTASSTGEEPYSIAMTACEAFDSLVPPVRIVASDIDTHVLGIAARGVYPMERVEGLERERLRRFFQRGTGAHSGRARVRSELRALIEFRQVNLLEHAWPVANGLAAIFCRNVLIYFDRPTQAAIVSRFAPMLAPAGLLFAGHSENLAYAQQFRPCGRTVHAVAPKDEP